MNKRDFFFHILPRDICNSHFDNGVCNTLGAVSTLKWRKILSIITIIILAVQGREKCTMEKSSKLSHFYNRTEISRACFVSNQIVTYLNEQRIIKGNNSQTTISKCIQTKRVSFTHLVNTYVMQGQRKVQKFWQNLTVFSVLDEYQSTKPPNQIQVQ